MEEFYIVITDDDEDDFFIIKSAFEDSGLKYELDHKKDGLELLDHLKELTKNNQRLPHLILLDINMPKINGITTLERIKKEKAYSNIPVIMYSTTECPMQKQKCIQLGALAFVVKGSNYFKVLAFADEIDTYLKDQEKIPVYKEKNNGLNY